jgi:septal ring factor EnvC (AmiA/AmiB activator)
MPETTDIVLEHLKAIRQDLADVKRELGEHRVRFQQLEAGQAHLLSLYTTLAAGYAALAAGQDTIKDRLERIERRLDLTAVR